MNRLEAWTQASQIVDDIISELPLREYRMGAMLSNSTMTVVDQYINHVREVAEWLLDTANSPGGYSVEMSPVAQIHLMEDSAEQPPEWNPDDSNLVKHARHELELLGEDADTIQMYLDVISAFARQGHSGGSASVFIPVINQLLQFKNLKPLTDDPREWNEVGEESEVPMWQSRRNPEAFSNDCGRTYYLVGEPLTEAGEPTLYKTQPKPIIPTVTSEPT